MTCYYCNKSVEERVGMPYPPMCDDCRKANPERDEATKVTPRVVGHDVVKGRPVREWTPGMEVKPGDLVVPPARSGLPPMSFA